MLSDIALTHKVSPLRRTRVRVSAQAPDKGPSSDVLVIEDEPKLAMVVSGALESAGFRVTAVDTGTHGLRARTAARETPIMVLSAVTDVGSNVACLELGACDYVAKPFERPELVARMRLQPRERARAAAHRELQRGRYTLDRDRRVVRDGAGDVPLTTREFLLLEYLMDSLVTVRNVGCCFVDA
jgi:DNA-binding response OmpR family regulator